jgi:hypothetical protein
MISAKHTDLVTKIFAALWIVVLMILKGLGKIDLNVWDIVGSGAAITAIFAPVWVSLWLDKIAAIKGGGKNGN